MGTFLRFGDLICIHNLSSCLERKVRSYGVRLLSMRNNFLKCPR